MAFIILYANYQLATKQDAGLPVKWIGFLIMTALVFGNAIRYSRPYRGSRKFWGLLALFLAIHFISGFLIVPKVTNVGLIHFAIATPVEYFALMGCLRWLLNATI